MVDQVPNGIAFIMLAAMLASPVQAAERAPATDPAPATQPLACTGKTGSVGSFEISIQSSGLTRTFLLRVPSSYKNTTPTPLVFNFHGYTMTAASQESYTRMTEKSNEAGFILVYPQGIGNSWNAGETCCGEAMTKDIDDVQFARDMIQEISDDYCIDASMIYSTGFSNGGYMSNRLACEASDAFAAVAPASGVIDIPDCSPPRPVPVIQSQGTADPLVPYARAKDTNEYWAEYNECVGEPTVVYKKGAATCSVYANCAYGVEVEWCEVQLMGHTWPLGQTRYGGLNDNNVFWDFFLRHPMGR